jgi:hypothetical protein
MLPDGRRNFVISWTVGIFIVLCCQIVALLMPATPGTQHVVLIGPPLVVVPALAVSLLILWLLVRRGKLNRLGGPVGAATTGFLGSFLTIFATTIAVNVLIANIARFSN